MTLVGILGAKWDLLNLILKSHECFLLCRKSFRSINLDFSIRLPHFPLSSVKLLTRESDSLNVICTTESLICCQWN